MLCAYARAVPCQFFSENLLYAVYFGIKAAATIFKHFVRLLFDGGFSSRGLQFFKVNVFGFKLVSIEHSS